MVKIAVIGSANTDMVVKTDKFPGPGETLLGGEFFMVPGGKGANQAVAASRLGGDVSLMCRVGDDEFGKRSIDGYKNEGIETDHIIIDKEKSTGVALISVNSLGENKIVVAPGANEGFTKQEINGAHELLAEAGIIILQLEIPLETIGQIINIARENNTKVILNPAPAQSLPEWYYEELFLITPNQTEAEELTGIKVDSKDSALLAAEWFEGLGVQNIAITMGGEGAFVHASTYTGLISASSVIPKDTTAAGDVFNGALAVALTQNKPWKEAVKFACSAAALSVTEMGAQSSSPTLKELSTFADSLQST